ncbi:MAG: hypothetical protein ACREV5_23440 [Steroidobacter sp.]
MNIGRRSYICLVMLFFFASPSRAFPVQTPLDDPFRSVVFDFDVNASIRTPESMSYDSDSQRLSYAALGQFELHRPASSLSFDGFFAWQVSVDAFGELLDRGSMLWFGDLGNGNQLLASGTLRDIGFGQLGDAGGVFSFTSFRAVFDNNYLDDAVADFGPRMGLFFEVSLLLTDPSPFTSDFACDLSNPPQCPGSYFSTSGLTKIVVPEPSAVGLFALGFLMLGLGQSARRGCIGAAGT